MLSRRSFIRHLAVGLAALAVGGWERLAGAEGREYYRLVVLGDPHLPVRVAKHPKPASQQWFRKDLAKHRDKTTLVFFHGPLNHTLLNYKKSVNTPKTIAMPADAIDAILTENPQVRLWVSGHTHTPCNNPSYADKEVNRYNEHTYNIHNDCMDRKKITTNSIYLYEDHIEVRTFDHKHKKWLTGFDRSF